MDSLILASDTLRIDSWEEFPHALKLLKEEGPPPLVLSIRFPRMDLWTYTLEKNNNNIKHYRTLVENTSSLFILGTDLQGHNHYSSSLTQT